MKTKIKTKKIVCGVLIAALAAANAYSLKRNNDLRGRMESVEKKETAQAEKNSRYENAIGFFKNAVASLNMFSNIRVGVIDFYASGDTTWIYDINGKYPEDYNDALKREVQSLKVSKIHGLVTKHTRVRDKKVHSKNWKFRRCFAISCLTNNKLQEYRQ